MRVKLVREARPERSSLICVRSGGQTDPGRTEQNWGSGWNLPHLASRLFSHALCFLLFLIRRRLCSPALWAF